MAKLVYLLVFIAGLVFSAASSLATFFHLGVLVLASALLEAEPNGLPGLARLFLQMSQGGVVIEMHNKQNTRHWCISDYYLFLVPLRGHLDEVVLCPNCKQLLHCTCHMPLFLELFPFISKQLAVRFFLCLLTGLFCKGGLSLNPSSTCAQRDLSVSGLMTPAYASLKWFTEY